MSHAAFNSDYAHYASKTDNELVRLSIYPKSDKDDRILTGLLVKRGIWTDKDYTYYWELKEEQEVIYGRL